MPRRSHGARLVSRAVGNLTTGGCHGWYLSRKAAAAAGPMCWTHRCTGTWGRRSWGRSSVRVGAEVVIISVELLLLAWRRGRGPTMVCRGLAGSELLAGSGAPGCQHHIWPFRLTVFASPALEARAEPAHGLLRNVGTKRLLVAQGTGGRTLPECCIRLRVP